MKPVNYQFKILYAIGITFVVMGHCTDGSYAGFGLFTEWFHLYSFHVGLFVFCSGYFYKDASHKNIWAYIWKKIKTFIIPLYVWNALYAVMVYFLAKRGFTIGGEVSLSKLLIEPITSGHQFAYNMGGWFVIPLFMIETFNVIVRKAVDRIVLCKQGNRNCEFFICVFYLLLGIGGNCLAQKGLNTGWWLVLVRMLYLLPFFGIGALYKRVLEKYDTVCSTVYFTVIMSVQLVIILVCGKLPVYIPSWCNAFPEGPVLPIVEGCLGIAFWLRAAKVIEPILGRNKLVLLIADNTFSIMIHQFLGFMFIKTVFALLYRAGWCADFNWEAYKSDIWYHYFPKGMEQSGILYIAAGLFIPIVVQICCSKMRNIGVKQFHNMLKENTSNRGNPYRWH